MKRIVLAGILGGVAMMIWGFISHEVLPLGTAGLQNLPNEDVIAPLLKNNIPAAGLYFFPGYNMSASKEEQAAWVQKYMAGPCGLLVYSPTGENPMSMKMLSIELLSNIFAALFAALVVANFNTALLRKAFLVSFFGLAAWCSLSLSYWNWFNFPTAFILAEGIDQIVGFFVAGLVIAWMQKPARV